VDERRNLSSHGNHLISGRLVLGVKKSPSLADTRRWLDGRLLSRLGLRFRHTPNRQVGAAGIVWISTRRQTHRYPGMNIALKLTSKHVRSPRIAVQQSATTAIKKQTAALQSIFRWIILIYFKIDGGRNSSAFLCLSVSYFFKGTEGGCSWLFSMSWKEGVFFSYQCYS